MLVNKEQYKEIIQKLHPKNITLVAVSKTKPVAAIAELYGMGQHDFGENYVQEMVEKHPLLPSDIRWHFIGHLQTNKVKYIASFVSLIHGVDSFKLLKEINKQALKNNRTIDVLLQVHIAAEETKFGLDEHELHELMHTNIPELQALKNIKIRGVMGMASFTADTEQIRKEFRFLKSLFNTYKGHQMENCTWDILSMGMSADYTLAVEEGSNMVRIGSLIFGERNKA